MAAASYAIPSNSSGTFLANTSASVLDLATGEIETNPTWVDLWGAFASVMDSNVENPIVQLENLRYVSLETEASVLADTARLLGFDVSQDVLNLNAENLTKIVSQLPMYPDQNGNENFVNFIDLALNAKTRVTYLYTKDYVNFYDTPGGLLVIDGGSWFKTTHITLFVALQSLNTLALSFGQTLFGRTVELFSNFAPVHLVVRNFVFDIEFFDQDWLGNQAFGIGTAIGDTDIEIVLY